MSPALTELHLSDVSSLVEFPSSLQNLLQLRYLEITNCINLETFPTGISLPILWKLNLSGCSRLRTFPDISTNIERLNLRGTAIEEVPCSIEKFSKLKELDVKGCINLETVPTGISLQFLSKLYISGCSRLRTFPGISTKIEKLNLSKTAIEEVPCWIEKFSNLQTLKMSECNNLEYVNLNISKLKYLHEVDFSDCKSLTGASWSSSGGYNTYINFNNCINLDKEALLQQRTYLGCQLRLSGEEVPSYFTHRTTGSSSLSVPLLHSSLSQPFLRFRACIVLSSDIAHLGVFPFFKGRFWNSVDSFGQAQDFQKVKEIYAMETSLKSSHMLILEDCRIHAEMNYTHVDLQLDFSSEYKVKEWGIRLCSSAEEDEVTESSRGIRLCSSAEEDEVTEPSTKGMPTCLLLVFFVIVLLIVIIVLAA